MFISEINLNAINSEFIGNIKEIDDGNFLNVEILPYFKQKNLDDFNNRKITPENINYILDLCCFLLIENILDFIVFNSTPTSVPYILNELHSKYFKLPDFMCGKIINLNEYILLNWIKYWHENNFTFNSYLQFEFYSKSNNYDECFKYLLDNNLIDKNFTNIFDFFAANNKLESSKYFHKKYNFEYNQSELYKAVEYGNVEYMKYIIDNISDPSDFIHPETACIAAFNGHLECMIYIINLKPQICNCLMSEAMLGNNINIMNYLSKIKYEFSQTEIVINASRNGLIEYLIQFKNNNFEWNANACVGAIEYEHYDCLEFLIENNCPLNSECICKAVQNRNIKFIEFLIENNCPKTSYACTIAARNGDLEILKILHKNNFTWGIDTCTEAAKNGNFECLKYAHINGAPWDVYTSKNGENIFTCN